MAEPDSGSDSEIVPVEELAEGDGKVYPKEAYPGRAASSPRAAVPAGLLPGGGDCSSSDDDEDERNVKYFVPKFSAEALDEFLLDLMLCIRTSVLNGTKVREGLSPDALDAHHFTDCHYHNLQRGGTDHRVRMVAYAPVVFQLLRESCGLSTASFLLAWSSNEIRNAQVEGSELVYSCDKRFLAKLMTERDRIVLLAMLPKYYAYVRANPNTFLLRVFGLVSVSKGKKLHTYMVAENIFHFQVPLHFMFHVAPPPPANKEGSSGGGGVLSRVSDSLRRSRASSGAKSTLSRSRSAFGGLRSRSSSLILDAPAFAKDKSGQARFQTVYGNEVSWQQQGRTVLVERALLAPMVAQMESDLAFLRANEITDYQLVVGIHEGEPNAPPSPDMEAKRMVKVPSMVVFCSDSPPASPAKGSPLRGTTPATSPQQTTDFANLRRSRRISVSTVDAERPRVSPYRTVKGGLHSRSGAREELYYLGFTDIFAVNPKEKKRAEKASQRQAGFSEWLRDNLEGFDDTNPKPVLTVAAPVPTNRSRRSVGAGARLSLSLPASPVGNNSPVGSPATNSPVLAVRSVSAVLATPEPPTPEPPTSPAPLDKVDAEEKTSEEKTPEEKTPEEKTPEEKTPEEKPSEEKTPEEKPSSATE